MRSTRPKYPVSYSAMQKYLRCPASYDYHYNQRIRPKFTSSSLVFGIALDKAVNLLLETHPKEVSDDKLKKSIHEDLFRDEWGTVKPSTKDWDPDLFELVDKTRKNRVIGNAQGLDMLNDEYSVNSLMTTLFEKEEPDKFGLAVLDSFCRECLNIKAFFLVKAYQRDVLPKIKKVISSQERLKNGVIDAEIQFIDNVTRIVDNKTSTGLYADDQIDFSMQLTMYARAKKVEDVAYIIMNKNLVKDRIKTCKKCGVINKSTHQSCNEMIDMKDGKKPQRCHGEFDIVINIKGETQVIFGKITKKMKRVAAETVKSVKKAIKACIFPCNFDQCNNQFGKACDYRDLKWKGSMKGLKKL